MYLLMPLRIFCLCRKILKSKIKRPFVQQCNDNERVVIQLAKHLNNLEHYVQRTKLM